jgi:hypothetical protein
MRRLAHLERGAARTSVTGMARAHVSSKHTLRRMERAVAYRAGSALGGRSQRQRAHPLCAAADTTTEPFSTKFVEYKSAVITHYPIIVRVTTR